MKKINYKIIRNIIIVSYLLIFISICLLNNLRNNNSLSYNEVGSVNCFSSSKINTIESYLVMEVNSNRVLSKKNENEKMFMASTTKILTAIVIIENCNLNDEVLVTKKTTGIEGSSIYLEPGEKLTVKQLLYGLMLRSGNDCAETLAVFCSNSIENFAELMNLTAKKIGANSSNFVNPHGLHNDNHYTTAYDLALISSYAIKNDTFKEIVSTKWIEIPFTTKNYNRKLKNKNKLLWNMEGATGIKTGYTKNAGRCLVTSCEKNGMELVSVVLNCPPMFEKTQNLLNDTFSNYKNYKLVNSDNFVGFINIINSDDKCGLYIKKDIVFPLTEYEYQNLKIEYDYPKNLEKLPDKDMEIGKITISTKNNLLFIEKIYTII